MEKINPVVDFDDNPAEQERVSSFVKIHYGVKQFSCSDKGKDILTVIIIILVGLGSFGLGRLSKNSSNPGIKIEYERQGANVINSLSQDKNNDMNIRQSDSKNFFASNRGSKYYSLGCPGGKTIKQENRIYFKTSAEAERSGYELSNSCK